MRFLPRSLLLSIAVALPLGANAEELPKGEVIRKVVCVADESQSYAFYIPTGFDEGRIWPVIFCFDPGARGSAGVERLQEAAQKYGYLVAGSNNSRNGGWEIIDAAAIAMLRDVGSRFKVDGRRIYTAGLSGGARAATRMALAGISKGVIACSAGFPTGPVTFPEKVTFPFFGTAGVEDMNRLEMIETDEAMESRSPAHRLEVFAGGHEWAPAAVMTRAVEWIELYAMRTGTRTTDPALVQALLKARVAAAPAAPAPQAWLAMSHLAADFKGLADTSEFERRATQLAATREIKDWQKAEHTRAAREEEMTQMLFDTSSPRGMKKTAADVMKLAGAAQDSEDRQMARRIMAAFNASTREVVRALFDEKQYENAAAVLDTMAVLRPGQSRTYYDLARARSLNGERKEALVALGQAVSAGYTAATEAEAVPAFQKIKSDAGFQALLASMRKPKA